MTDWNRFLAAVEQGVARAATGALADYATQLQNDTKAFLAQSAAHLQIWTAQLARGEIDQADLAAYVQADVALAALEALTQAGLAAVDLQRFRDTLVSVVTDAALAAFKLG